MLRHSLQEAELMVWNLGRKVISSWVVFACDFVVPLHHMPVFLNHSAIYFFLDLYLYLYLFVFVFVFYFLM